MTKDRFQGIFEFLCAIDEHDCNRILAVTTSGNSTFRLDLDGKWNFLDDVVAYTSDENDTTWIMYESIVAVQFY